MSIAELAIALGMNARIVGRGLEDNPYAPFDPLSAMWIKGWVTEDNDLKEVVVAMVHQSGRMGGIVK